MTLYIERRAFIAALGGMALWRLMAHAQEPHAPVIGFLGSETAELFSGRLRGFREGLRERGYVEGQNVLIQYRWAEGRNDRLPELASDLVRAGVNVIVAGGTPAALAAKAASASTPLVFATAINPVTIGLAKSLVRPGGNSTGVTTFGAEIGPKQLELLQQLSPAPAVVALLVNPTNPAMADIESRNLLTAAGMLGVQLRVVHASADKEFDAAFAQMVEFGAGALVIGNDLLFNSRLANLARLCIRHGMPAIHQFREFAQAGGLMSYGSNVGETYRQLGACAARILKGESAADLQVQQAAQVELIINLKSAATLNVTFPLALLSRADAAVE
jgi:putative ABC transport system substrate-binding protein